MKCFNHEHEYLLDSYKGKEAKGTEIKSSWLKLF